MRTEIPNRISLSIGMGGRRISRVDRTPTSGYQNAASDARMRGLSALRMVLRRVVIDVRCPLLTARGLTLRSASTWLHENVGPIH